MMYRKIVVLSYFLGIILMMGCLGNSQKLIQDPNVSIKMTDKNKTITMDNQRNYTQNISQVQEVQKPNLQTEQKNQTTENKTPVLEIPSLLELGDSRYATTSKKGYVYVCNTDFANVGAFRDGQWIQNGSWEPDKKTLVDGNIVWQNHKLEILIERDNRVIKTNGLPDHDTGIYPIAPSDDAYNYDRNPNTIKEQNILLTLPKNPQIANSASCVDMGIVAIAKTGAVIFNSLDERGNDAPAHELQDRCGGHPQQSGIYHYHSGSDCIEKNSNATNHSDLVAYIVDGFGLFGKYGQEGKLMFTKDLDECHGHIHEIFWDGELREIYHYHISPDFPYTISCLKGNKNEIVGEPKRTATNPPPQPREAVESCSTKSLGNQCSFMSPNGMINGQCQATANGLACAPAR